MTKQDEMIGKHPTDGLFCNWIDCYDTECTDKKKHRYLQEKEENRQEAIETVAHWLVTHHLTKYDRSELREKQKILEKYDFQEFANSLSLEIFPKFDKTKKGNLGEILLTEYLSQVSGIKVLIYKLHYNPNVDQSMKGDDVLLVDSKKILLGESKFRATPTKKAVEEISESMSTILKLPITLSFIRNRLFEQHETELAQYISDIKYKMSKKEIDIKNIGFLLSTKLVKGHVERNMNSKNEDFLFISLGMDAPADFMELAFTRAKELLLEVSENEY